MTAIPYWNMPDNELIHEARLSDDDLTRKLGECLEGRPSEDEVAELDGKLGDAESALEAVEDDLLDLYAVIGFDHALPEVPPTPLRECIKAFHRCMEDEIDTLEQGIYDLAGTIGFDVPRDKIAKQILPDLLDFLQEKDGEKHSSNLSAVN